MNMSRMDNHLNHVRSSVDVITIETSCPQKAIAIPCWIGCLSVYEGHELRVRRIRGLHYKRQRAEKGCGSFMAIGYSMCNYHGTSQAAMPSFVSDFVAF